VFENDINPVIHAKWLPPGNQPPIESFQTQFSGKSYTITSPDSVPNIALAEQPSPVDQTPSTESQSSASQVSTLHSLSDAGALQLQCSDKDCHRVFERRCDLKDHIHRRHHKRYTCQRPACGKAFHLKADLNRHTRTHSALSTRRIWSCNEPTCARSYDRKDNMLRHFKKSHHTT
jgi:hypothetical protein